LIPWRKSSSRTTRLAPSTNRCSRASRSESHLRRTTPTSPRNTSKRLSSIAQRLPRSGYPGYRTLTSRSP